MKPFLKWAGGKTQLLDEIRSNLPVDINKKNIYIEGFVGAGSVFLNFLEENRFEKYIINDINFRLINLYKVIRDDVELLITLLTEIRDKYLSLSIENDDRKEMYYEIRDKFNSNNIGKIELAAYFIFLNKTCFNGLFRENSKGEFNVPIGSYEKNPDMFDGESLREISVALNRENENGERVVEILNLSYNELSDYINKNTFVYLDPPYRPVTKGGFATYNKSGFNDKNQVELANFYTEMSQKGASLMLSNSDQKNLDENDKFFDELYANFNIQRVQAKRSVNSKGSARGKITEILVTNY